MDGGNNLWYMICRGVKHAVHSVWSIKCLITFNQIYRERLEQWLPAYWLEREELRNQPNTGRGFKSPSLPSQWREGYLAHTWQRQSAASSARGNKREGGWQTVRKKMEGGCRRQVKKGDQEREHKPEAWKERWMDKGEHTGHRMKNTKSIIVCFDCLNVCGSLWKKLTEGELCSVQTASSEDTSGLARPLNAPAGGLTWWVMYCKLGGAWFWLIYFWKKWWHKNFSILQLNSKLKYIYKHTWGQNRISIHIWSTLPRLQSLMSQGCYSCVKLCLRKYRYGERSINSLYHIHHALAESPAL